MHNKDACVLLHSPGAATCPNIGGHLHVPCSRSARTLDPVSKAGLLVSASSLLLRFVMYEGCSTNSKPDSKTRPAASASVPSSGWLLLNSSSV